MKLVHKIVLANTLGIISIILVAGFSYNKFNLVLTKLRFVQIADNLNATFLNMRLAEKNYFLYDDDSVPGESRKLFQQSFYMIEQMDPDIVKAIGESNFEHLKLNLKRYEAAIARLGLIDKKSKSAKKAEISVRDTGKQLRLFSENMVNIERQEVNGIIATSKKTLLIFFGLIILVAIVSNYLFFSRMFKNLRRIEKTANLISEGTFVQIKDNIPQNELGSAMIAIDSMCKELQTRHEQLIQSRKLASLGTLTAGVAHELGNPLNNISMVAQTYLEVYDHLSSEDRLDYMKTVLNETDRIKKIVQNLLDFSRTKETDFRVTDINDVLRSSLKLVQNMLDVSGMKTKLKIQENLPPVFIDEDKIREVFVNILSNSIHAMSAGNSISLSTRFAEDKKNIIIEIEDTGKGIPAELLGHIFDPFFTTKGMEGTGLGLSISYGIIKKHRGAINVKSEVGVGTTFTISLPIYRMKEGLNEQT
jgi:two-component system NtrC family sensor kinase